MKKDKYRYYEPLHHFAFICAIIAAMGLGMLVSFNKRVAESRGQTIGAINALVNMPISTLPNIRTGV